MALMTFPFLFLFHSSIENINPLYGMMLCFFTMPNRSLKKIESPPPPPIPLLNLRPKKQIVQKYMFFYYFEK